MILGISEKLKLVIERGGSFFSHLCTLLQVASFKYSVYSAIVLLVQLGVRIDFIFCPFEGMGGWVSC